jgi:hypothetical protein
VLFRTPLAEVAAWPAAHVDLLSRYLAQQPAADERIDIGLAGLRCTVDNFLRAEKSRVRELREFLPFFDPWETTAPDDGRYSETDIDVLKALGK